MGNAPVRDDTGTAGESRPSPVGQEQTLLALAVAMRRAVLLSALAVGVPAVAVSMVVAGLSGALSALAGAALATAGSLFTLWLMRLTAARSPRIVMLASLGGSLQKMVFFLAALFTLGAVEGVQREALSITMLAVLVVTTAVEGAAAHRRLRTWAAEPLTGALNSSPPADGRPTPGAVIDATGDAVATTPARSRSERTT